MKQFLLGIVATLVAGLAVFVGQRAIESYDKSNDSIVRYVEYSPSLYLSEVQMKQWASSFPKDSGKLLDNENRVSVKLVTIENFGEKPIVNQRVVIHSKYKDGFDRGVVGYQNDTSPGSDDRSTRAIVKDRSLFIDYDLIDVGEVHRFWLVADRYSDLNFVIRKPGLKVSGWDSKIYLKEEPEDWTAFYLFGGAAAAIALFLAGAIVNNSMIKKTIQARGLDFDDLVREGVKKDAPDQITDKS